MGGGGVVAGDEVGPVAGPDRKELHIPLRSLNLIIQSIHIKKRGGEEHA